MSKQTMMFSFALASSSGPYDEASILPDDLDIRLTLSRNGVPQPFHLICEHDSVLVTLSGEGEVEFKGSSVNEFEYGPGDVVYVPAGTPHRIVPSLESIHHRFKLPESELEGVAFHCDCCGAELHREIFALADELPQAGYLRVCTTFMADPVLRRCAGCGELHPELSLDAFRWAELAGQERANA